MVVFSWLYGPIYGLFIGLYVAVYNVLVIVIGGVVVAVQICGGVPIAAVIAECTRRLLSLSINSFVFALLFSVLTLASFTPSIWMIGAIFASRTTVSGLYGSAEALPRHMEQH